MQSEPNALAPQATLSMPEQIRAHMEKKFAEAKLEMYPFPHLVIEGIFPDDVYARILELNPFRYTVGHEWISKKASAGSKTRTPYYARKQINFTGDDAFVAPNEDERRFWSDLQSVFLGNDWFPALVTAKYRDYFTLRFGELVESPDFYRHFSTQLFLQRHEPGYYIGPHTDIPTRVFTCIFSFADRKGFEEYGTELCAPKNELERCWGNNHYPPDRFVVRKVAPYQPNTLLLFFKTRQSFHSVRAITEEVPNQRYGMQYQFYEAGTGVFQDLSEPELLVTRHLTGLGKLRAQLAPRALLSRAKRITRLGA